MFENRDLRQRGIVPNERLDTHATIIGVGAGGRDLALSLAILGIKEITLIDPQKVEEINLASQGYREKDIGEYKVNATADLMKQLNSEIKINTIPTRFNRSCVSNLGRIVFSSVDSIDTRKHIYGIVKDLVYVFIDGRASAETIQVFCVYNEKTRAAYKDSFFAASEAYRDSCTGRSTNFIMKASTAIKIEMLTQYFRDIDPPYKVEFNLFSMELSPTFIENLQECA